MDTNKDVAVSEIKLNVTDTTKAEDLFKDEATKYTFNFETTNEQVTFDLLDAIFAKELEFMDTNPSIIVNTLISELPFDLRTECIRHAIVNDKLIDSNFILNLFNLIKGYNTFDDRYFEAEEIFVNSIEEYLDLKVDIQIELLNVQKELIRYYLSCIRSYAIINIPDTERYTQIPYIYQRLLFASDYPSISNLMKDLDSVTDLIVVENGAFYINNIAKKAVLSDILISSLMNANKKL